MNGSDNAISLMTASWPIAHHLREPPRLILSKDHQHGFELKESALLYHALVVGNPPHGHTARRTTSERTSGSRHAFRLQANVRRGNGSSLPGAWPRYLALNDAREAAREMLRDERVHRVTTVADIMPRFVEWVNR